MCSKKFINLLSNIFKRKFDSLHQSSISFHQISCDSFLMSLHFLKRASHLNI